MSLELRKLTNILESFLGECKPSSEVQLRFNCPRCAADKGVDCDGKFNLEVNIAKQKYNCWSCGSQYDDMHGSVIKLIKVFGNEKILNEYKKEIYEIRQSKLYELNYSKDDFNIDTDSFAQFELEMPKTYKPFNEHVKCPTNALKYLLGRNIGWDIINEYHLGYTLFDNNDKMSSTRIIIPSFNEYGELNYWTGRDYSGFFKKQKYYNPKVDRKDIIFNEEKIQWDCDITLVEGLFDHIVVPNSIPLLGKSLKYDFLLYNKLITKCKAKINIFLDGDAIDAVKSIYKTLNHGNLYNKIRYIPTSEELDPSKIFELGGNRAIIEHIKNAKK